MTTNKPPPREWWIDTTLDHHGRSDISTEAWSHTINGSELVVHVIEKSYADQLEKERDELRAQVKNGWKDWTIVEENAELKRQLVSSHDEGYHAGCIDAEGDERIRVSALNHELKAAREEIFKWQSMEHNKEITEARAEIDKLKAEIQRLKNDGAKHT